MKRIRIVPVLVCCAALLSGCGTNAASGYVATSVTEHTSVVSETVRNAPEMTVSPEIAASETDATEITEAPDVTEEPIDTAPPFFLYLVPTVTLPCGSTFDLHRYISYIDDLDATVDLLVEGGVDTATVGDYPLELTLRDDAGNTASATMTVQVTQAASSSSADAYTPLPSKSFAAFAAAYQSDGARVGIDVSKWQGGIDFHKVAAAGCEFVIIRIGGYADGLFTDAYYASNLRNAKAAGLKVGVYWYSEENGPEMVRENAAYLYSLLDGETLDFPVFFDWEDFLHFENYEMSMRDLNEMFLAFREEAEAHGYKAALYNSKHYLDAVWSEAAKADGVWLAHYTEKTSYDGAYFLWQQGLGKIDGITGDVDVDVFYPAVLP